MDNLYTCHELAKQTEILSNKEIKMIGTVKFKNIAGKNHPLVKEAIDKTQSCKRGSPILLQAFDKIASGGEESTVPS